MPYFAPSQLSKYLQLANSSSVNNCKLSDFGLFHFPQADAMLVKNAQNLMQAVVKTLKAAEAACVKVIRRVSLEVLYLNIKKKFKKSFGKTDEHGSYYVPGSASS